MPTDPRVDAYITKAAPFAQPILTRIRAVVHTACPDVVETMKWSFPHFDYKGIFCGMAAFKAHCTFGFWKHAVLVAQLPAAEAKGLGRFDRMTSLDDLPGHAVITRVIKAAAQLNDEGVKVPRRKPTPRPPIKLPVLRRGAQEEQEGARGVRRVSAESSTRVSRVDHGRQIRRHSHSTVDTGAGMDRRGEIPQLEVRAEVPVNAFAAFTSRARQSD